MIIKRYSIVKRESSTTYRLFWVSELVVGDELTRLKPGDLIDGFVSTPGERLVSSLGIIISVVPEDLGQNAVSTWVEMQVLWSSSGEHL